MEIDIGIADYDRKNIADGLSRLLADTFHALPQNPQLSLERDGSDVQYAPPDVYGAVHRAVDAVDAIAERIRALGYPAPGSYSALFGACRVSPQEPAQSAGDDGEPGQGP